MKNFRHLMPLLILGLIGQLLLASCGKDGETGPKGKDGVDGINGVDGKAGVDGSTILSGTSNPGKNIGKNGDFYLNLSSKTLFGPKENDQWATSIVLSGNDGANGSNGSNGTPGTNGNTILSGQGLPTFARGQVGDFYLDLSKMDFYGPKTTSSWGTPISLKPSNPLSKRILLKEDIGFTLCQSCYTYETDWLPGYSTFSVTTPEVFLNVGDISDYFTKGQVIYEARVNGREWIPLDQAGKKEIQYNYSINGREYDILFIPAAIQYYNRSQLSFPTHSMISIKGIQSMQNLINYMKAEAKIDVKITLVPKETIEVISKAYPDQNVDVKFVSKYLSIER